MLDAPAPVEIGHVLAGKYRIDRVLGAGGMGVVVAATHVQLDQRVAIKFLLPQALANADVVARFQREARAAVKIQSEHVARVIDVGTLESGAPYMVMEYLEGTDLAHRIASEGKLPLADAARFVLEACEALAEAHSAGIIHRDLKPANLFLARRADKTSMVKVLDFGISKISSSSGGSSGGVTSTQAVMGSPYYMSPEQLMSAKHVDARADVWSLGIVLYEALVGSPPYVGETLPEIVAQILQAPAPSIRAHRSDISQNVDRILATCLAKDPNARYRDVAGLARDLAPLTTDGARSVERISRILDSVRPPATSISDARASSPDGRGSTVAMQPSSAGVGPAAVSRPQSGWGATNAVGIPQRSHGLLVGLAVSITLALGAIGFIFASGRKHAPQPAAGIVESPTPPIAAEPARSPSVAVTSVTVTSAPSTSQSPIASSAPTQAEAMRGSGVEHARGASALHAPIKPAATAKTAPAQTTAPIATSRSALDMTIK